MQKHILIKVILTLRKLLLLPLLLIATSCSKENPVSDLSFAGSTMGTTYSIKVVYQNGNYDFDPDWIQRKIDSVLVEVNAQMSTYIPASEISVFNHRDSLTWFSISEDFAFVLHQSIELGYLTNGALDITIAPLVNIWGFGPDERPRKIPTDTEISESIKLTGLNQLELVFNPAAVRKKIGGLKCDLSSTAKGFGVDKVFNFLKGIGFENIMVEIGGEVRAAGKNQNGEFWKIGVSTPDQSGSINYIVPLNKMALATSGDYWNYFEENGIRYSHTIDPKTGKPIVHKLASVTVIDSTCLRADGFATAIFVMGPEKGFDFAVEMELPVYLIVRVDDEFEIKKSPKFLELFEYRKE